jgi:tRNA pseudouridine 55 synthase
MNGILNILKPCGMTSFDVVARIRGLLRTRKCGHTGTLDPLAAGVLPICIGNATKAIEYMVEKDKLYRAELTLGTSTDTQDSTGSVVFERVVECTDMEIEDTVKSFIGDSMQLPPMYSAIKVNGVKLYELAREGIDIDRTPRLINIHSIDIVNVNREGKVRILFDVHCSKGTYIRTLCSDIGDRLGCGGHMSFLLRKRAGAFDLSTAITLEELKKSIDEGYVEKYLNGMEVVFDNFEEYHLDDIQERRLRNGIKLPLESSDDFKPGLIKVFDCNGKFFALGEIITGEGGFLLKSKKFFG